MCAADTHAGDARSLRALDIREIMALRATAVGYTRSRYPGRLRNLGPLGFG